MNQREARELVGRNHGLAEIHVNRIVHREKKTSTRWLPVAIALVFLLLPQSSEAAGNQASASQSVHVAVVLPAEYPTDYIPLDAACSEVEYWLTRIQDWWTREDGKTFDYDLTCYQSQYTILQFGATAPCPDAPFGVQGARTNALSLIWNELGWSQEPPVRGWVVLIGAGGWAGSMYPRSAQNFGWSLVGDWQLQQSLTGRQATCSPWFWGDPRGDALGWEALNSMGVIEPHGGLNTTLDRRQKRQLDGPLNRTFLRDH